MDPAKWLTITAVPFSWAALFFAAPASADQTDDAFIAALAGDGIVMPDRGNAISMAHTRHVPGWQK